MSDKVRAMISSRNRAALITGLIVLSLVTTGFVWAQKEVYIVADDKTITVDTLSSNPNKILKKAGIVLEQADEIELSTKKIEEGTVITVNRAVPISFIYQGNKIDLLTAKQTLREAATQAGIPEENIKLDPGGEIRPYQGLNAKAITLSNQIVEQEVPEPFAIVREPDSSLEKGAEAVTQNGSDGLKKLDICLYFEDGQEVRSEVVSETVLVPTVNKIVRVGTRDTIDTSRGAMRFKEARYMEATAYLPTDGDGQCITATGIRARRGIVAVDPRYIPLGTRVYIEGYGVGLAADTGGAIKGNKIDLCMDDLGQALRFGRRTIKVYILE